MPDLKSNEQNNAEEEQLEQINQQDRQNGEEEEAHEENHAVDNNNGGGGDANENAEEENEEDPRSATARERFSVLKQKLVIDHKAEKEARKSGSVDKNDSVTHTTAGATTKKIDSAADYIGYGGIAGAVGSALGGTVLQYGASMFGKDDFAKTMEHANDKELDASKLTGQEQTMKDVFDYAGLAGNALSTVSAGMKAGTNLYRSKKEKNKYKKSAAKYRAASGLFAAGGSMAGAWSNMENLGFFGGRANSIGSAAAKRGGAADIIAGIGGAGGNILDYMASKNENEGHASAAKDTANYAKDKKDSAESMLSASRETLKRYGKVSEMTEGQKKELQMARMARHTAKAQKYAMGQAAKLHEQRSHESNKGFISMLGGLASGVGSLSTGISKIIGKPGGMTSAFSKPGTIFGTIGSVLGAVGGVLKLVGAIKDKVSKKKEEKKLVSRKNEVVDEYLEDKAKRIQDEAKTTDFNDEEKISLGRAGKNLTMNEARKIALLRLGVEVSDIGDEIPSEAYNKAFDVLTEKRAKNILLSSDKEKEEMLGALGLEKDASFEDVVSALKAE